MNEVISKYWTFISFVPKEYGIGLDWLDILVNLASFRFGTFCNNVTLKFTIYANDVIDATMMKYSNGGDFCTLDSAVFDFKELFHAEIAHTST